MTSTEYDRIRLEALPAAVKILDKIRWDLCTDNRPAWNLLYDAAEHTKKQNAAEWKAYFTPQPDPPPAPPSDLLSFQAGYLQNIVKERADAIRHPEPTAPKSAIIKQLAEAQGYTVVDIPVDKTPRAR